MIRADEVRLKLLFSAVTAATAIIAPVAMHTVSPIGNVSAKQSTHDWVEPDPKLIAAYQTCSNAAAAHLLSPSDARQCADTNLALKLSFLPDEGAASYWTLSNEERWAVQKSGYAAYRLWRDANLRLVRPDQSGK